MMRKEILAVLLLALTACPNWAEHPDYCAENPTSCGDAADDVAADAQMSDDAPQGTSDTNGISDGADSMTSDAADSTTDSDATTLCTPGTLACAGADGSEVRKCNADGSSWVLVEACAAGTTCDTAGGGRCDLCAPGTLFCLGKSYRQCAVDGQSSTAIDTCATADLCSASGCAAPACTAGETRCNGKTVQTCNAGETGWTDTQTCPVDCVAATCMTVSDIATTASDTNCSILSDGTTRCWGSNATELVGDGSGSDQPRPVVITALHGATQIAIGIEHACAILADATVACWGSNNYGQLGDGTSSAHATPMPVSGLTGVRGIAVGLYESCALGNDGLVRCWGAGRFAGDGSYTPHAVPTVVPGVSGVNRIAAGVHGICAFSSGSGVLCWGFDDPYVSSTPKVALTGYANPSISVGGMSSAYCVYGPEGASCWGANDFAYQFGNSFASPISAPTGMPQYAWAKQIALGQNVTCIVRSDDSVACMGSNNSGQLGDGGSSDQFSLVSVVGLRSATHVIAARQHACAVAGGVEYCWGTNSSGQLGVGASVRWSNVPVLVNW